MEVKPGYKQTEVGIIPEEWEYKRLGDLGRVVRGGSPRPAGDPRYFNGRFIPWLTVGSLTNISSDQMFVTDTATMLTEEGAKHSRMLQKDTLVIVNSGARTLGVSKVLSITCCANDGIAALVDQHDGVKLFLCYFLNSQIKRLREIVAAGNDQLNLNTDRIALLAVPFPKESEQHAIADALSDVDGLLGGLDRLIAKKRDLKQAARQQLLTGQTRLPGFQGELGVKLGYKQTEVGVIPEEWEVRQLGKIANLERGKFTARPRNQPKFFGGDIPFIQTGDVTNSDGDITNYVQTLNSEGLRVSKLFPPNTMFFTIAANIGDVGIAAFETAATDSLIAISPNRGIEKRWLYHTLRKQKTVFEGLATQNAQLNINLEKLRPYLLAVPPLPEQTAIAAVLSDMDAEIAALERRREKTRALKQAMMQELLTGKTRLVAAGGAHA